MCVGSRRLFSGKPHIQGGYGWSVIIPPPLVVALEPGVHMQHSLPEFGIKAAESPQIIKGLQRTAKTTDTAEMVVQTKPVKTIPLAKREGVSFRDAPFHQRIPLHIIGAVLFGGAIQAVHFVGGKADTLLQGEGKILSVRERQ